MESFTYLCGKVLWTFQFKVVKLLHLLFPDNVKIGGANTLIGSWQSFLLHIYVAATSIRREPD